MSKVAVIDARKDLADILNRAAYGKERVVLTRRGKGAGQLHVVALHQRCLSGQPGFRRCGTSPQSQAIPEQLSRDRLAATVWAQPGGNNTPIFQSGAADSRK